MAENSIKFRRSYKTARHLGTIGGNDMKDCLRKILTALFATVLARQYNYLGMKGKRSFSALHNVLRTLHEGVRKLYPDSTETQMRDIVTHWLSGSRDRENGKKQREARRASRELVTTQNEMEERTDI
ncbi:hypothetical protein ACOMHN_044489 [Nucella lapillus]